MIVIGIDPGASGAVARLAGKTLAVWPMPWVPKVGVQLGPLRQIIDGAGMVFIEKLFAMHGQSPSAAVTMGTEFGRILGMLETIQVAVQPVAANTWKAALGLTMRGSDKRDRKFAAIKLAQSLWPGEGFRRTPRCSKPCDGMAEAALIAEWGRRKFGGT